jgi:hypothetical protein
MGIFQIFDHSFLPYILFGSISTGGSYGHAAKILVGWYTYHHASLTWYDICLCNFNWTVIWIPGQTQGPPNQGMTLHALMKPTFLTLQPLTALSHGNQTSKFNSMIDAVSLPDSKCFKLLHIKNTANSWTPHCLRIYPAGALAKNSAHTVIVS